MQKFLLVATILTFTFALACIAQENCKRHTESEGGFSLNPLRDKASAAKFEHRSHQLCPSITN